MLPLWGAGLVRVLGRPGEAVSAQDLLHRWRDRAPSCARTVTATFDFGRMVGVAVEVVSPSGRVHRNAARLRPAVVGWPSAVTVDALERIAAQRFARKLKRWLR